jgi:hypothetical protein
LAANIFYSELFSITRVSVVWLGTGLELLVVLFVRRGAEKNPADPGGAGLAGQKLSGT